MKREDHLEELTFINSWQQLRKAVKRTYLSKKKKGDG
jgi:hypothetical protein